MVQRMLRLQTVTRLYALTLGCIVLLTALPVAADTWVQRLEFPSGTPFRAEAAVADAAGNLYVAGHTAPPQADAAVYGVLKLDAQGRPLWAAWATADDPTTGGMVGTDIAVDAAGNAYVSGAVRGTVAFGETPVTAPPYGAIVVARLRSTGQWQWVRTAASTSQPPPGGLAMARALTLHADGTVYVAGQFFGTTTFGGLTVTGHPGGSDIFVATLDAAGQWQWAQEAGGRGRNNQATAIAVNARHDVYITGAVSRTKGERNADQRERLARFGDLKVQAVTPQGQADAPELFVARLDAAGHWQWVTLAGPTPADSSGGDLALDSYGQIYLTGRFRHPLTLGNTTLTVPASQGALASGKFIAHLNAQGQWKWAQLLSADSTPSWPMLAISRTDRVYVIGTFQAARLTVGDTVLTGRGQDDIVLAEISRDGTWQWAQQAGGTAHDVAHALTIGADQTLLAVGTFTHSAQFGETRLSASRLPASRQARRRRAYVPESFLARLHTDGRWRQQYLLTVRLADHSGQPYQPQTFAAPASTPQWYPDGTHLLTSELRDGDFVCTGWTGTGSVPRQGFGCEVEVRLDRDSSITWQYEKARPWVIGQAVEPPPEAVDPQTKTPYALPEYLPREAQSAFFWSDVEHKLYAVSPVTATLQWRVSAAQIPRDPQHPNDPNDPFNQRLRMRGTTVWPASTQTHVAGAPVELQPSQALTFANLIYTQSSNARVTVQAREGQTKPVPRFHNPDPGTYSVLLYTRGKSGDISQEPPVFQVIRTVAWHDPAFLVESHDCRIGQPLHDASHQAPQGRNGYVVHTRARYDATLYQRQARTGPIVPVNTDTAAPDDDLVVVWYSQDAFGGLWPTRPVRYHCTWPEKARQLVIAGQRGSGPLPPQQYVNPQIYYQPDAARPGYNPNEEHALFVTVDDAPVLFALRADLNRPDTSEPYVLLKYRNPETEAWSFAVYRVTVTDDRTPWPTLRGTAGSPLQAPRSLSSLQACPQSHGASGPFYKDHKHAVWAKAQGEVVMRWFYPLQKSFWYDLDGDGKPDAEVGTCVPWLDRYAGTPGTPAEVHYRVAWPARVPTLRVGETLMRRKHGLPEIDKQRSVEIVHDAAGVRLFDPLQPYHVSLPQLPEALRTARKGNKRRFPDLAPHLYRRLAYDQQNRTLTFAGVLDTAGTGDPLLLPSIMSRRERDELLQVPGADQAWREAINTLYARSRTGLTERRKLLGGTKALSAGAVHGTGYVTLVFNDDPSLQETPVAMAVLKVDCPVYVGQIQVIPSPNIFDEALTLRHSGDFGGEADRLRFEWHFRGGSTLARGAPDATWQRFITTPLDGRGAADITIRGARPETLSDNWFFVRYTGYEGICATSTSAWAGAPGSDPADPTPQLAEGWIKRVLDGLNPFEARVKAFHQAPTNTYASMLIQAGRRYEGDIAFNPAADNLNDIGLIEAYTTVLRRGKQLSIDATPPIQYAPANDALLLVASRIANLYMLLGNEAAADASDPTIGFSTAVGLPANRATALFAFTNQVASLLDEELALWRGRDASGAPIRTPPYNHLVWNFTRGEGEVAYEQTYNIADHNHDGTIDEQDARIQYPQGHGDAWGHYLTAITTYYDLLRHPHYRWVPRTEAVLVAGTPVQVDYLDERKFARAAAAKAKAGAEIVQLTYRRRYAEEPARQWQGYRDSRPERAWGLAEWAARAGQGAYFDWVVGNAILPAQHCDTGQHQQSDCDTDDTRLTVIDRATVSDLRDIVSQFEAIETQMDQADQGLNPLGLARDVVPFDIDPDLVAHYVKTHFDQIYERAVQALQNALTAFNYASQQSQALRGQQDTLKDFRRQVRDREVEFRHRLIEIYGYPYPDDIGPSGTYAAGYDGPDIYHYDYVDASQLLGVDASALPTKTMRVRYLDDLRVQINAKGSPKFTVKHAADGSAEATLEVERSSHTVTYEVSTAGFGLVKPASWRGQRRAPGEIQLARSDLLQNYGLFRQAVHDYRNLLAEIQDRVDLVGAQYEVHLEEGRRIAESNAAIIVLNSGILAARTLQKALQRSEDMSKAVAKGIKEALPKMVGTSMDTTSTTRSGIMSMAAIKSGLLRVAVNLHELSELGLSLTKERLEAMTHNQLLVQVSNPFEIKTMMKQLEQLVRQEQTQRLAMQVRYETMLQAQGRYLSALATGERLLQELTRFRRETAANVQAYRYRDMSYRIFRHEALEKYRAQFDLAARYAYTAAEVYDYETNGLRLGQHTAQDFLTDIVRQRSLGELSDDGQPLPGNGLADVLARLRQNFAVLKPQLGLNNPQVETTTVSLRRELLRIGTGAQEDARWRDALRHFFVDDLWSVPAFRQFCRPFASESQGPQPGLVLPFWTTITTGYNLFGWPLARGDSSFAASNYATKIRGVVVGFANYHHTVLAATPRVYLVPAGLDIMRIPQGNNLGIRKWQVVDQKLPVPFAIGERDLANPDWIPRMQSLGGGPEQFRRFSAFRAYPDQDNSMPEETMFDRRLIARSIWNTQWVLIIPGATLLNDPHQGLQAFIGTDTQQGVADITLTFETYAYSGN